MQRKFIQACFFLVSIMTGTTCLAQDAIDIQGPASYDAGKSILILLGVFKIGLPLLILFLLSNAVVNVFKVRTESRLKEKALDQQLSEPTLIALFTAGKTFSTYSYLKYFLILAALGISFLVIHFLAGSRVMNSGYLAAGIIALFLSLAFLIYYRIIRDK